MTEKEKELLQACAESTLMMLSYFTGKADANKNQDLKNGLIEQQAKIYALMEKNGLLVLE